VPSASAVDVHHLQKHSAQSSGAGAHSSVPLASAAGVHHLYKHPAWPSGAGALVEAPRVSWEHGVHTD
jgi:hypothetical protein